MFYICTGYIVLIALIISLNFETCKEGCVVRRLSVCIDSLTRSVFSKPTAFSDSESSFLGFTPLLGALVGVAGVLLLLLIVSIVIARHARRKASKPPVHTHDLVLTPTGSAWDCYDPEGGTGLQPRHRSLDILAHTHGRATPDGAHSPENNNTPTRRRQGTPAVGKRVKTNSMPHIHMNGRLSNCQQTQVNVYFI